MILLQAAITNLGKSEDLLEDAEGPLHFGAHCCPGAVLAPLHFVDDAFVFRTPRGHVLRLGCGLVDRLGLPLITGVAPDLLLCAMQQVGQHMHIRD